jgi:phage shock protein C
MQLRSNRLYRARQGAMLAGIARGMADWSGLPVWLVRVLWLLTLAPGGVPGLLLYVLCWFLIPKEPRY